MLMMLRDLFCHLYIYCYLFLFRCLDQTEDNSNFNFRRVIFSHTQTSFLKCSLSKCKTLNLNIFIITISKTDSVS